MTQYFESIEEVKQFLASGERIETERWKAFYYDDYDGWMYFKIADQYVKFRDLDKLAKSVYRLLLS